jgi:hypothetical protein
MSDVEEELHSILENLDSSAVLVRFVLLDL